MSDNVLKEITKLRFDLLEYNPFSNLILAAVKPLKWFSDENEIVLGTIFQDRSDRDFCHVLLGRDKRMCFRCIKNATGFDSLEEALADLSSEARIALNTGAAHFPQEDEILPTQMLFKPCVEEAKFHPYFKTVLESEGYAAARKVITEIGYNLPDVDGNFVKDFQTTGFNSRIWEMGLFAFFQQEGYARDTSNNTPDFCLRDEENEIYLEAVTVNPSPNPVGGISAPSDGDSAGYLNHYMPIKFGSALWSKVTKVFSGNLRYWELPHTKGKPFILAIHDFSDGPSMSYSRSGLEAYLFGQIAEVKDNHVTGKMIPIEEHVWGSKVIPSNFFKQQDVENVSAVLFSNAMTIAKFNRMGHLAGFSSPNIKMTRVGMKLNADPKALHPIRFYEFVEPNSYDEDWGDELAFYHNPYAKYPLNPGLFPKATHFFIDPNTNALSVAGSSNLVLGSQTQVMRSGKSLS